MQTLSLDGDFMIALTLGIGAMLLAWSGLRSLRAGFTGRAVLAAVGAALCIFVAFFVATFQIRLF